MRPGTGTLANASMRPRPITNSGTTNQLLDPTRSGPPLAVINEIAGPGPSRVVAGRSRRRRQKEERPGVSRADLVRLDEQRAPHSTTACGRDAVEVEGLFGGIALPPLRVWRAERGTWSSTLPPVDSERKRRIRAMSEEAEPWNLVSRPALLSAATSRTAAPFQ